MKTRAWLTWSVASLAFALIAAGFSACGGGGGGTAKSGTIQLTGSIDGSTGTGYGIKSARFAATGPGDPSVDKILAVSMDRGSLNSWSMSGSKTADIAADGGFSLSLDKTTDWLLVLIDSSATGTGRFVGSVALSTATAGDSLLNLPATDSTLSTLSLGTVSRPTSTTTDAVSSEAVAASDFNMTSDQLAAMAKTDDLFRNAMNIVNNYGTYGGAGVWYSLRPDFSWQGDPSELTSAAGTNPAMTFKGMSFQLDTNAATVTLDALCTARTTTVKLIPPALISTGTANYDPSNPITSAGCTLSPVNAGYEATGSNFYATDQYEGLSYSFQAEFTSIPDGTWLWKENDVLRAAFDVNTVSPPYVPGTNTPSGFVPSFRINLVAGTKQIDSVDVKWFYYDNGVYTPVAPSDFSVLKHFISRFEVKFDVTTPSGRKTCEMYFDPATESTVKPANFSAVTNCAEAWYFNDSTHPATNTGVMGFYESGGFGYFFHFPPI